MVSKGWSVRACGVGDLVSLRFFGEDSTGVLLKGAVLSWLPSADTKSLSVPITQGCRGKVTRNGVVRMGVLQDMTRVRVRGDSDDPTKQQSKG